MAVVGANEPAFFELVRAIEAEQDDVGHFACFSSRGGERRVLAQSPFATTFVAHAMTRATPLLEGEARARAQRVLDRARAALSTAADEDGRVRFFGPGSAIRPDVDDTACVWLARSDEGQACPSGVLDAIAAARTAVGGYANDFDLAPPHALELASTAHAIALLERAGRVDRDAVRWVEGEAARLVSGASRGMFFPSRGFAAFVLTRAAVDLGAASLERAARTLATWVASAARPDAPLLERTWSLWVLEASGVSSERASALRTACLADLTKPDADDAWFVGDPRSFEREGLEVFGCRAVRDAVLLDAFTMAAGAPRRLAVLHSSDDVWTIDVAHRDHEVARLRVSRGSASHVVELVRDAPDVAAYRRVDGVAVRYRGSDGAAAQAADAVIARGRLAELAAWPPREAAVRREEPLTYVLRFLARGDFQSAALLDDLAALRDASDPRDLEIELSFKAREEALLEGPRFTFYQHRPDARRVLEAFATLAGTSHARTLAQRLEPVCRGLPIHLGVVHGPKGRAVKLYVRTDETRDDRHQRILSACIDGLSFTAADAAPIHGIGIATRGDSLRVRAYVTVPRDAAFTDVRADELGLEGWDLSADAPPKLESKYVHYRSAELTWPEAVALAELGPNLAKRIGAALDHAGLWQAGFFGVPSNADARSIYLTLGPRVPRSLDHGP